MSASMWLKSTAAAALLLSETSDAAGMGFNNMNNWPGGGLSNVRIWDMGVTWRDIHQGKWLHQ